MHSEALIDRNRYVRLYEALGSPSNCAGQQSIEMLFKDSGDLPSK
jgi:hypothetical protein